MHKTTPLAILAAIGLLAAAAPTQAIYIETPLTLEPGQERADVGDEIEFTVAPNQNNESAADDWAGKTVKVRYFYDRNENPEDGADAPTSDDGYTEGDITTITLDDSARGTFAWRIPSAVNDHNVDIFLEDQNGERVAFTFVGVGDADPQMRLMAGSGPADGEPELNEDDTTDGASGETDEASAIGAAGLLAVGALALLGVARRR